MSATTPSRGCIGLLGILLGAGCVTQTPTNYYTLRYPLPEANQAPPIHNLVVGVARFQADRAYQGTEICFRLSDVEVAFDRYRRWAVPPEDLLTELFITHLERSGLVSRVTTDPHVGEVDLWVLGRIRRLEEVTEPERWHGHLEIDFQVLEPTQGDLLFSHSVEKRKEAEQRNTESVVRALRVATQEAFGEFVDSFRAYLIASDRREPFAERVR